MSNANYIGRVGALAVALGVGIAVASTPWVARADETGSASSDGPSGATDATATGEASQSPGTSTTTGNAVKLPRTSTGVGSPTEGASAPGTGSVGSTASGASASTDASVRQVPPGIAMSTGGADSSTRSDLENSAIGDVAAALPTDDSAVPKPAADATVRNPKAPPAVMTAPLGGAAGGSNRKKHWVDDPTAAPGVDANTLTAVGSAGPSRPDVLSPPRTVIDVAVQQPAAQQSVTAIDAGTYLPPQPNVVAQANSAASTEPTNARGTVSAVVLAALATAGLGPLAPTGPLAPVDSPLGLALLAVGARPRQFGQPAAEENRTLAVDPTLSSQAIDTVAPVEQQSLDAATAADLASAAPIAGTLTLLGNNVTVTGNPPPARPVLTADGTRALLVTPVTNLSTHTTTTQVAVINTATGQQIGSTLTLTGAGGSPVFSADGTRALITTSALNTTTGVETTRVTLINTTTGAQIGTTLTLGGSSSGTLLMGAGDSRALIITDAHDVYHSPTTHIIGVAVINTITGAQIGAPVVLAGSPAGTQLLGIDGSRALVTTVVTSGTAAVSQVAVIDTTTGARIGTPVVLAGSLAGTQLLGIDGSRALVTTVVTSGTAAVSQVAVIDTTTGARIGTPVVLAGSLAGTQLLAADGSGVLVTTAISNGTATVSQVAMIDSTSGALIGTPVVLVGSPSGTVVLGDDDSRALITAAVTNGTATVSQVAMIDSTSGALIGTPVVLVGSPSGTVVLGDDDSRALITTQTSGSPYDACDSSNCITRVAVINTATGQQIGATLSLTGRSLPPVLSADGSHALITTQEFPANDWNPNKVRVALINTTNGTQLTFTGSTTAVSAGVSARFNADGTRAMFTTYDGGTDTTSFTVINTSTDTQIGTTLTLPGEMADVLFSPDGARAVITSFRLGTTQGTTRVAVMNTMTGTQLGATVTLLGDITGPSYAEFTDDGSRLVLATPVYRPGGGTLDKDMRIVVINTTTGTQMGTVLTLPGGFDGIPRMLTAGDTRALFVTEVFDGQTQTYSTRVAVINTVTGTQVGTTLTIPARIPYHPVLLGANDTHALLGYTTSSIFGSTTQVVVINTITGAQTASVTLPGGLSSEPLLTTDDTRVLITTAVDNSRTSVTTRVAVLRIA